MKAEYRKRHPVPVKVDNGKGKMVMRYTDGHIHKLAQWRTITRFAERLYADWTKFEHETREQKPEIVEDHELVVFGKLHVQFGAVAAARNRVRKGGQRVLGAQARAAAVGDIPHGIRNPKMRRPDSRWPDHPIPAFRILLSGYRAQSW